MAAKVLVSGAGIAGLSAAISLYRMGFSVDLLERQSVWRPAGAGIMLQANALAILDVLGLGDKVRARGRVLPGVELRDHRGRLLLGASGSDLGEIVTIHRAALHQLMLDACTGINTTTGQSLAALKTLPNGRIQTSFSNGGSDDYDAVIGADGLHSQTRQLLCGENTDSLFRFSGQVCWRLVVPNHYGQQNALEMWGERRRVGLIPLGDEQLYIFLVKSVEQRDLPVTAQNIALQKQDFEDFGQHTPELLDQSGAESGIIFNPLGDLPVNWGDGRVALIGDAAHAMTPNMGQGAAMALEDVAVLTEVIQRYPLEEMASRLAERRADRVNQFRQRSYSLGNLAHLGNPIARTIRNSLIGLVPDGMAGRSMDKLYRPGIQVAAGLRERLQMSSWRE